MPTVDQVFPVQKQAPLEGLYLGERLRDLANELGRSVVLTDYLTDRNGVVAKANTDGQFQVPVELKNSSDWGRFQELVAQADVIISGGSYFKRLATSQDVLYQFEPGNAFEELGQWRLDTGYQNRSPDVAVVTRHLDFELPQKLIQSDRKISIFTTDSMANSDKAKARRRHNIVIAGSGETGVDGARMIATLASQMRYRVIMMVSGPQVLHLLLAAERLDRLYVTRAELEIRADDRARVQTLLPEGKQIDDLEGFRLAQRFVQEHVVTEDGSHMSQSFLRYDRQGLSRARE